MSEKKTADALDAQAIESEKAGEKSIASIVDKFLEEHNSFVLARNKIAFETYCDRKNNIVAKKDDADVHHEGFISRNGIDKRVGERQPKRRDMYVENVNWNGISDVPSLTLYDIHRKPRHVADTSDDSRINIPAKVIII